jgi:hypothetical protein
VRKFSPPNWIRSQDRPARSESLYRRSYRGPPPYSRYKLKSAQALRGNNRSAPSELHKDQKYYHLKQVVHIVTRVFQRANSMKLTISWLILGPQRSKFHRSVNKSLLLVSLLSQFNSDRTFTAFCRSAEFNAQVPRLLASLPLPSKVLFMSLISHAYNIPCTFLFAHFSVVQQPKLGPRMPHR